MHLHVTYTLILSIVMVITLLGGSQGMLMITTIGSPNTLAREGYPKPSGKLSESIPSLKQVSENPFNSYHGEIE